MGDDVKRQLAEAKHQQALNNIRENALRSLPTLEPVAAHDRSDCASC
jgi:hypothetical protein